MTAASKTAGWVSNKASSSAGGTCNINQKTKPRELSWDWQYLSSASGYLVEVIETWLWIVYYIRLDRIVDNNLISLVLNELFQAIDDK